MVKNFFYNRNKNTEELSEKINNKIKIFIEKFSKNKEFQRYIKSFGVIGPAARNEGFYIDHKVRSDVDLYLMTNYISLSQAKKIHKLFNSIFEKDLDVSLLIFSPNSFKRPDLLMYELTNSGHLLYGEKLEKTSINKISRFEGVRNLVYRGFFFLDLFVVEKNKLFLKKNTSNEKFLYSFSKIIFALGEVLLLLDRSYMASNFERNSILKTNKFALKIKGFLELHEEMHLFRYENKIPKNFDVEKFSNLGFKFLLEGYKIIFKELFGCVNVLNCEKFLNVKSFGITFFANRILYFLYSLLKFKKIKIFLFKEPFVVFVINYVNFLDKIINNKKIDQKNLDLLIEDWKTAPFLYYFK